MNADGGTRVSNLVDKFVDGILTLKQKEAALASPNKG
jgi:hypothetical protein